MYVMPKKVIASRGGKMEYYLPCNFIIDTGSHIYFYQREPNFSKCGFISWIEKVQIPLYIDLKPKDLIEIPSEGIEQFVKFNILNAAIWNRKIVIASPIDTVFSPNLSRIMKIFRDTSNHITYKFRKTTQEENFVLDYKKKGDSYYDAFEIKWDSTKTLFPEVLTEIVDEFYDSVLHAHDKFYSAKNEDPILQTNNYFDSVKYKKLAAALRVKVEDLFILEKGQ